MNNIKKPGFLIAGDILQKMFEGKKDKSKEVMEIMKRVNDSGKEVIVKTPMSHFLRAIWLSDPKTPIQNIQKVLSFTEIIPSFANFKNEKECVDEVIMIAKIFGGKLK